ncbi:MAG: cyclic nucleotide-binding domain-containing protein [Alphaproteobacteria bacterium]|nr:cyclic nucleotide-binding domain-containing protein [Alphaproteobacteria bacterium]
MTESIEAKALPEQSILETLYSAKILENLETEALQGLARISHRIHLQAGEMVITEGEKSTDLFLIEQGDIEVFRMFDGGARESRLVILGPGEPLGEMALLDGQPRSASARAVCQASVLRVRASDLLSLPKGEKLLANLQSALAVAITRRARASTDKTIAALERELAAGREQNLFGQFFVYVLGVMAIGTLVNNILAKGELDVNIYTQQFAWQYLLVLIIPSALVMLRMKIPLRQMGITTEGLKKSLIEGAVASVILIALAFGAAQILAAFNLVPGKPQPFDPAGALAYFFS